MEHRNLPGQQRREALQRHPQSYREGSPEVEDHVFLRKDMEQLIEQTTRERGQVKKHILHAEIREDGERYLVADDG